MNLANWNYIIQTNIEYSQQYASSDLTLSTKLIHWILAIISYIIFLDIYTGKLNLVFRTIFLVHNEIGK